MMKCFGLVALLGLTSVLIASPTSGLPMGEETFGNQPLNAANYTDWPNIMPVINHTSRVYHTWVNGDEESYFQGTPAQLNQLLASFSKLKSKKKEVLILPQRKKVRSFDGTKSFEFNCSMHLVGGIAKHIGSKPKGSVFWPLDPQLTIYVTPGFDLNALKIPADCQLVSLDEITQRYNEGLTSDDKTVRGWGVGFLASVDPYNTQSLDTIAKLAVDADSWVALNALSQIHVFGPKAKGLLPLLKKIGQGDVAANAESAQKASQNIVAACEESNTAEFNQRETLFRQQAQTSQAFIDRRRGL